MKGLISLDNYTLIDCIELSHAAQQDRKIEFLKNVFQNIVSEEMHLPKEYIFGSSEFIHDPKDCKCMEWKNLPYTSYYGINEKKYWNLDIVIAYLRLHEYLPINWNQHFKVSRIPNRNSHQRNENWPGIDVDYRIFSFEKWMAKKPSSPLIHPARFKYNVWKNCSDGIKIFNIQDSKLLSTWYRSLVSLGVFMKYIHVAIW